MSTQPARRPFFRRRKTCPFSGANAPKIDYKDTRLLSRYKSGVTTAHASVGESWEVSVEPTFPSVTRAGDRLDARIAAAPQR